ncbi:accessory gene regulator protein B [Clostridium polyendosporum]|uniref:Accessory gene regulator protein B n=2 Tax=Clostridium polyendosporum TaxID=69208 RepID=A0A919VGF9_9CLOT|nr:accessory gene regulator protein B [Clostridium polyendosporum]
MERLSNNIANKISSELKLDNDRREVVEYGAFVLLQTLLSIILVVIFGWLFNVIIEALLISFIMSILRKYSGGVHASASDICAIIGTIVCVGLAILISYINSLLNLNFVLILGVLIFIWSYYIVYKLVPVDSPTKPIKNEEKRKRMKKSSITILNMYLIIVVFIIVTYLNIGVEHLLNYSLCIYVGLAWQVFTLTSTGHFIMARIDTFFNKILISERR